MDEMAISHPVEVAGARLPISSLKRGFGKRREVRIGQMRQRERVHGHGVHPAKMLRAKKHCLF